ncbi:MAG TPA: PEGA domain-containing protein [Methanophagales archaeon]|nr:PEGA domain-containing protein [Methanophagales archaeon]
MKKKADGNERGVYSAGISSLKKGLLTVALVIFLFAVFVAPLSADATLIPIPILGSISVSSSPSGATILLDGFVGQTVKTPYTFADLLMGTHTVELFLEGYEDWSTNIQVTAGETTPIHVILTPICTTGSISISSSPSGATIVLDGLVDPSVKTPYTFTNVSTGNHTVELSLDGYVDWSTNIQVAAGKTTPAHAILTPIPTSIATKGAISVNSSPSGATIGLEAPNGRFVGPIGKTPYTFTNASIGTYTVELALEGYEVWSGKVQVTTGETSHIHAILTPGRVKLNEIMYNPQGLDKNREWLELYNTGPVINLTGWKFFEGYPGAPHELTLVQGSMVIPFGGHAIIAEDATTFLNEHPACNCTVIESGFKLSNRGEFIALKDATLDIIDEVTYYNSWGADGNGRTLELNVTDGWEVSLVDGGTPCDRNSVII